MLPQDRSTHDAADTRPRYTRGGPSNELATIRDVALPSNVEQLSGAQLYDAWCATCHQDSAQGTFDAGMPPLFHDTTHGRPSANNLVLLTLEGIHRRRDTILPMPAFADHLTDHQVAALDNRLVARYGNPAAKMTDAQVRELRRRALSNLVPIAQAAIGVVVAAIVVAIVVFVMQRCARQTGQGVAWTPMP